MLSGFSRFTKTVEPNFRANSESKRILLFERLCITNVSIVLIFGAKVKEKNENDKNRKNAIVKISEP